MVSYHFCLFYLQISLEEIDLKCGVDCIFLTTKKQTKYDLDICLPYDINNQNVDVTFNTLTKVSNLYIVSVCFLPL